MFEVKGIQSFIFSTGRLKDMVAGSELIDLLCRTPLDATLQTVGLDPSSVLCPRRAGGAFYLVFSEAQQQQAQRFRRLWPLLVDQLLPGIEQIDAFVNGSSARDAIEKGLEALRAARNRPFTLLPLASPLAQRSPRTGAVATDYMLSRHADRSGENLDAATFAKRCLKRPTSGVIERFQDTGGLRWPVQFERDDDTDQNQVFPLDDNRLVAVIHADGNGLGEVLRMLNDATKEATDGVYIEIYRTFSEELEKATCDAAKTVCQNLLRCHISAGGRVPARPLVLGGDDLTVITRADLALDFVKQFATAFEQKSKKAMDALRETMQKHGLAAERIPEQLTVCAGITYMKVNQPFAVGYELAENLCKRAKKASRNSRDVKQTLIPSSVAFHRVQGTLVGDADALFKQEMIATDPLNGRQRQLALTAYGVGTPQENTKLPRLEALEMLCNQCFGYKKLNDRRLRSLATLIYDNPRLAQQDYRRWRDLADKNAKSLLQQFDEGLRTLIGNPEIYLPFSKTTFCSPLADLLTYLSLQRSAETRNQDKALAASTGEVR